MGLPPALPFPLPRKVDAGSVIGLGLAHHMRVDPGCVAIWNAGRTALRRDTYIGVIDCQRWTVYLAPCFGLGQGAMPPGSVAEKADQLSRGNFAQNTVVVSNSTSGADAKLIGSRKGSLEAVYGEGNVCYVELNDNMSFDGQSHKAMYRWVRVKYGAPSIDWNRALGFALQRDNVGYYIRFSSTLNQGPGQVLTSNTFTPRTVERADREPRDLPSSWAVLLENALARDLGFALAAESRIVSRGEGQTTKIRRLV